MFNYQLRPSFGSGNQVNVKENLTRFLNTPYKKKNKVTSPFSQKAAFQEAFCVHQCLLQIYFLSLLDGIISS